jgi:hypothetical protein
MFYFLFYFFLTNVNTYYSLYVYYSPLRRRDGTPQRRGGIASEARKMGLNDVTRRLGPGAIFFLFFVSRLLHVLSIYPLQYKLL